MFQQMLVVFALAMLLALASIMSSDSIAQAVSMTAIAAAEDQRCQLKTPAQPLACPLTVAAGDEPDAIAVNPVTNKFYVANQGSDNVTVIDGSDNGTTDGREVASINTGPGSSPNPGQVSADQFPYTAAEGLPPPSIVPGDEWHYFKGTAEPPTGWNTVSFDDSSWGVGPAGFGYGDGDDATVLNDMEGNYASVYLRQTFNVLDPSAITSLRLWMDYDDSFVAYLNGVEVARSNVDGSPPAHDALATASHEASGGNTTVHPVEEFDITPFIIDLMIPGENVLALQGHNLKLSSSDFSLIPSLLGVDSVTPVVTITTPSDGASYEQGSRVPAGYDCADEIDGSGIATCVGDIAAGVAVDTATLGAHSFTVTATDIAGNSTTSIHNYTVISAPLPLQAGNEWRYFKGTAEPPDKWISADFDDSSWDVGPAGFGYGDGDDATVLSDMKGNYASVYLRQTLNVGDPSAITSLLLWMDYDDSFVAYLNSVEVARSNVRGDRPAHDALAIARHEASGGNATVHPVEEFDITPFISNLMIPGKNVLALQGHNLNLSSSDFSLIPSLLGVDSVPPVVTITAPSDGATYKQHQSVLADYSCADESVVSGIANCVGDVAVGFAVDTATLGAHSFTVTATDFAGNSTTSIHKYTVISASGESRSNPGFALEIAELVHQLINQRRQAHGLSPLGFDTDLAEIAHNHSADMAENDYFDHENTAGENPTDRGAAQGYDCHKDYGNYYTYGIAENIFQGWLYSSITYRSGTEHKNWNSTQEIAEGAVGGWMNSPGHRANILKDTYDLEGIGVAIADNDKVYVTQDFC